MPSRILKRFKNTLIYFLTRLLIWKLNLFPRSISIRFGGWLGGLAWKLIDRDRQRVHDNLQIAYGDTLTYAERENVGRQFFINSGKNLVDVLRLTKHFQSETRHLVTIEGREHFDAAHRRGKGILGITGHLGNFELLAAYIQSLGYSCAVIGREMYDKRLNELLVRNRESVGLVNIATTDSPKKIVGWLREGGVVGVLIDIDSMRVRSAFVPFFGKEANTPIGQSIIAVKTGAALVPVACVRMPGNRYKVMIRPEIVFERTGDVEMDALTATMLCTKALEEMIDAHRDQWMWIHTRWNTRPENLP